MTLLEAVRFNVRWNRHDALTAEDTDRLINTLTPVQLLSLISEALEEDFDPGDEG